MNEAGHFLKKHSESAGSKGVQNPFLTLFLFGFRASAWGSIFAMRVLFYGRTSARLPLVESRSAAKTFREGSDPGRKHLLTSTFAGNESDRLLINSSVRTDFNI
jgi:hypothetical protein